jgi:hypothetical protein
VRKLQAGVAVGCCPHNQPRPAAPDHAGWQANILLSTPPPPTPTHTSTCPTHPGVTHHLPPTCRTHQGVTDHLPAAAAPLSRRPVTHHLRARPAHHEQPRHIPHGGHAAAVTVTAADRVCAAPCVSSWCCCCYSWGVCWGWYSPLGVQGGGCSAVAGLQLQVADLQHTPTGATHIQRLQACSDLHSTQLGETPAWSTLQQYA